MCEGSILTNTCFYVFLNIAMFVDVNEVVFHYRFDLHFPESLSNTLCPLLL